MVLNQKQDQTLFKDLRHRIYESVKNFFLSLPKGYIN